jgi:beta-lactam-binding protein with PASTA domain
MSDKPDDLDRGGAGRPDMGARIGARRLRERAPEDGDRPRPSLEGWTPYGTEPAWRRDVEERYPAPPPTDARPDDAPDPAARSGRRVTPLLVIALLALGLVAVGSYAVGHTVGASSRQVTIPVVRGQELATANNVMQELGLRTVLAPPVFDAQIQTNQVVGTTPPAGTGIRVGEVVTISFSSGPEPVSIPPLAGQPEDSARTGLSQVGLTPGLRVAEASAEVPAGSVIRSEPEVGTDVAPGTPVTLVVSSGPPPVVLPRVIGLTQSEAEGQLTEVGLEVEVETRSAASANEQGRVVEQSPAAGTVADPGATVTLTVGA